MHLAFLPEERLDLNPPDTGVGPLMADSVDAAAVFLDMPQVGTEAVGRVIAAIKYASKPRMYS